MKYSLFLLAFVSLPAFADPACSVKPRVVGPYSAYTVMVGDRVMKNYQYMDDAAENMRSYVKAGLCTAPDPLPVCSVKATLHPQISGIFYRALIGGDSLVADTLFTSEERAKDKLNEAVKAGLCTLAPARSAPKAVASPEAPAEPETASGAGASAL